MASLLLFGGIALAVHDNGLFELDVLNGAGAANVVNDGANQLGADDWADIYADVIDGTPAGDNSDAFAIAFIEDTFAANESSFFTGGGSKDTLCIQDPCADGSGASGGAGPWLYDTVNDVVPDKNDIVNAFAAAYEEPGSDDIIFYFGLDSYENSGSNTIGFWFFRQPVTLGPLNGGTSGGFVGDHSDGDIFVAAELKGNKVDAIAVYEWDNTLAGNKPVGLVLTNPGASCATAGPSDAVCGVLNSTAGESPPWPYVDKDGTNDYNAPGALVEFGLNITELFDQTDIGCFSTFLAETRSSQSASAQLKDFAIGSFPVCGIEVEKTGDELSKAGDDVNYSVTIENTGRATLYKQSIIDSLVGDLTDGTNVAIDSSDCGDSLAPGATCTITYDYTVQNSDPDPLENTVTIEYTESADPNSLSFPAESSHSVNLFQPSITFEKTGDDVSKIGDLTDYTITLTNTSSDDTPDLTCTTTDDALGVNQVDVLASGDPALEINASAAIPQGADDPYTNTADVSCAVDGFPNVLTADASHDVNLFQPSIEFDKSVGNAFSKAGDTIDYTITLDNTSSDDSPALDCTITDAVVGVDDDVTLVSGGQHVIQVGYMVQEGDADPYENTANVSCSPDGFPNMLDAEASATVDLIRPDFTVAKVCTNEPVPQEGPATWDVTIDNTGDVELIITADDGIGTFNLPAGQNAILPVSQDGPFSGQTTVSNTVTASWVLPAIYGLDNTDEKSATAECEVGSRVELLKLTDGVVNDTFDWQFAIFDGPNEGELPDFLANPLATDSTLGDVDGVLDFDNLNLDPDNTYTICELATNASAGWLQVWTVNGQPATQYSVFDVQNQNVGVGCIDFGANTQYLLTAGSTLAFEVDNQAPGGEPRTPGYWANWSSCSNGNQWENATAGDPDDEITALDELLQVNEYFLGDLTLGTLGGDPLLPSDDCVSAKRILLHRDIDSNRVRANDAAYKLARSLLAYELNQDNDACKSALAAEAAEAGHALLDVVDFTGSGSYLRSKDPLYKDAVELHGILDDYNNGLFCP